MNRSHRFRIAIFASGSGTNAERVIRHFEDDQEIRVELLLSNKAEAYALVRAKNLGIPTVAFSGEELINGHVADLLKRSGITHIVLAGFLKLMPADLIRAYPNRIINIHPALLPKFGGKGMYGARVHEAVRASGVAETGITIHLVNERYDEGRILFQATCPVSAEDTPDTIAAHVHKLEYAHFPRVIGAWVRGN